jgi:transposase
MELHFHEIANRLSIATSTAHRIYQQFECTANVEPIRRKARPELRALDEHNELLVIGIIMENPTLYLEEVSKHILSIANISVAPSTICRLLRRYGITRKRVRQVALQRNDVFRGTFMAHYSLFSRDNFVWLDETGSDARDHIRKYGYALRGMRPVTHRFLSRGRRTNAIAALSQDGMIALELVSGSVNGDIFFDFVSSALIPMMMPFNGINPRSILIMDNCSIHHVNEVKSLLQQAGIVTLSPPYSPDFNPAEEAFSYVKGYLRKHDDLLQAGAPLNYILKAAFESITDKHCESWINYCGYV